MPLKVLKFQERTKNYRNHSFRAVKFAQHYLQNRWPQMESLILQNPYDSYLYSRDVLNERWLEAEETIKQDDFAWARYKVLWNIK